MDAPYYNPSPFGAESQQKRPPVFMLRSCCVYAMFMLCR